LEGQLVPADDPVGRRYQEMLAGFDVVMAGTTRASAIPVLQQLPQLLSTSERLVAFVQARMTAPLKDKVVLAATPSRLMAFRDSDGSLVFEADREQLSVGEFATDAMWGNRLTLKHDGRSVTFKQLMPGPQADRIFGLSGGPDVRPNRLDLLGPKQPEDPGHPPLASLWLIALYQDRIIDHEGRHLPFGGGEVSATCDSAGNIAVTRGRNLAAKGVGTLFFGPIGLFGMGNAKHREVDSRELYLLVEGPGWAYTQQFVADVGAPLRHFAQMVNAVARQQHTHAAGPASEAPPPADPIAQLRELAALRDEGILTEDEFVDQKSRLLGGMK